MQPSHLFAAALALLPVAGQAASLDGVQQSLFGAKAPETPEYLPKGGTQAQAQAQTQAQAQAQTQAQTRAQTRPGESSATGLSFSGETAGAQPATLTPVVGNWLVGADGDNPVLVVDGRAWSRGQPAAGVADRARALYGERYAEFLDNVKAYAYFPYAVIDDAQDFREGVITLRFKGVAGRIDQAAGILFDLKPNGDYYTVRANPLEDNLVLWQFKQGKRGSVKWVKNAAATSGQWHELKVEVRGRTVKSWLDGKLYLTQDLPQPVSGRVGLWSKADSVVYFDDIQVSN